MSENLSASELQRVFGLARRRRYPAGEAIMHEGDPADSVHVIVKGRVASLVNSRLGQHLTFSIMGEGELFGELALLSTEGQRSATIRALEATETLRVGREDFQRLRLQTPEVSEILIQLLVRRVLRLSQHLREALHVPVEARICRRLLELAALYGSSAPGTVIPLSQDDLAGLTGAARATVNRVLREEERRGVVALRRRRVTIVDPGGLRRRAQIDY
ncbi:MAG: Crp/Fnr family transcriptional regulator [Candidatus Dormibacteraeota bacterium]|uniref:Crp/Fnr family transcriptional regulator n=1 Tax=Candidatus Dormiibacter inghamiae TaxID=3127013 RepID=A0A934N7A5_9BACT|nr:Crp/Fnr family transcriptional regulator [Candidatus Dormibacteraeota bacterium]MBJ7606756.1 Crp/Fnr family transcriptional regulator [Candidatus Dormibacteraeota bacterium]